MEISYEHKLEDYFATALVPVMVIFLIYWVLSVSL